MLEVQKNQLLLLVKSPQSALRQLIKILVKLKRLLSFKKRKIKESKLARRYKSFGVKHKNENLCNKRIKHYFSLNNFN